VYQYLEEAGELLSGVSKILRGEKISGTKTVKESDAEELRHIEDKNVSHSSDLTRESNGIIKFVFVFLTKVLICTKCALLLFN
jgi:hypothetical protein